MINKIIKEKIDINQLLIVTFTNAAASEMREKILEAIYKKIEEEPENKNLQKQIVLLNDANISTIHSFCLEVIKNYFYEIGISANFRIGDNAEIKLLKQETLEEDFFVRTTDELVPVEVKSNNNRSRSLTRLITNENYRDIHWGIKLADGNLGVENKIYTFPYFCAFMMKVFLKNLD